MHLSRNLRLTVLPTSHVRRARVSKLQASEIKIYTTAFIKVCNFSNVNQSLLAKFGGHKSVPEDFVDRTIKSVLVPLKCHDARFCRINGLFCDWLRPASFVGIMTSRRLLNLAMNIVQEPASITMHFGFRSL